MGRRREMNAAVEKLKKIGRTAGMDDAAMDTCLRDQADGRGAGGALPEKHRADFPMTALSGTPTFIVNGEQAFQHGLCRTAGDPRRRTGQVRCCLRASSVVELARILAGPWAGQTLADLGAEVIKVEAPEGDDTRRWGPPFIERGRRQLGRLFPCHQPGEIVGHLRFPHGGRAGDGAPPGGRCRCADREFQGRWSGEVWAGL